jgi:hypothetical protein
MLFTSMLRYWTPPGLLGATWWVSLLLRIRAASLWWATSNQYGVTFSIQLSVAMTFVTEFVSMQILSTLQNERKIILNATSTKWFRALVQYLRRLLGRLFEAENVNKILPHIHHLSKLWHFYTNVTFIIVIVDITKWKQHISTCKLISLFTIKERKKANSALCSFFNCCFNVLLLSTFLFMWWERVSVVTSTNSWVE